MKGRGFDSDWLEEVKRKNDIVSVVSKYIQLEQRGSKFWGCCPFHHEKTASFCVDQYEGLYHCFGCKEGGDVITFVQKMESCDFHDAVARLAEAAKMEMPAMKNDEELFKRKKQRDRILKTLAAANEHYHKNIYKNEAKKAQDYIKMRGFTRHELDDFYIGCSLGWDELISDLTKQGFTREDMLTSGVAQANNSGKLYDAMGERLVFPICNSFGEPIAFTARALEKTNFAKYKNTAETPVFQKGKTVFALHLLKKYKQEHGIDNVIIVEGQIDVMSMHRAGFKNTVACLGTAATIDHARQLKKLSDNVILCFDGDEAGIKATMRAIDIFRNAGCDVKIASLPAGKDPDEILKSPNGKQKMDELLKNALPVIDYYIEVELKGKDMNQSSAKAEFVKNILARLKNFSQPEQEAYLFKIRDLSSVPIDSLRRSLGLSIMPTFEKQDKQVLINRINGNKRAETFILASILHKKPYVKNQLDYNKLIDGREEELKIVLSTPRLGALFDIVDAESEFWKDLMYYDFSSSGGQEQQYFDECVWSLAEEKLKLKKDELMAAYKQSSDLNERRSLLMSTQEVDKKIREKNLEDFYA